MAKVSKYFLYSLRSTKENPLLSQGFTSNTTYTRKGKIIEITIGKAVDTADVAIEVIHKLGKVFPSLVSASQIAVSGRLLGRIERYQKVHCSVQESSEAVFQMLSNQCSGLKIPRITGVQLVCSTSSLSCKIAITADLSSFRLWKGNLAECHYNLKYPFTRNRVAFTSSTQHKIRHFHVVVVQWRQRNVQKRVMHVQSCCFAYINLLLFCVLLDVALFVKFPIFLVPRAHRFHRT